MEKIEEFKNKLKNKMQEKLHSNMQDKIFKKKVDIEKIKNKFENQKIKKGNFLQVGIQNFKNNDISVIEFCLINFLYVFFLMFLFNTEKLTCLTYRYEELNKELELLDEELSELYINLNSYINYSRIDYSYKNDIFYVANNMILSEEELYEISKIFNREDLMHLAINSIENIRKDENTHNGVIQITYANVLYFLKLKETNDIEEVSKLIFNV